MPASTPTLLKQLLVAQGFEVYRTVGNSVHIADRVRDNLIMDSGVAVVAGDPPKVRIVFRAQANDFPGDTSESLFERVRDLGAGAIARSYDEIESAVHAVPDPGDAESTLDTWYQITFERTLASEGDLEDELRVVLALEKVAANRPR